MTYSNAAIVPQSIDNKLDCLLAKLDCVRAVGNNKWIARCPGHTDKNPSLSIRLGDSGILIRDFAGCDLSAILLSIGLRMCDLFPDRPRPYGAKVKAPKFSRYELFDTLIFESNILFLALCDIKNGAELTEADWRRVNKAMTVIDSVARECRQ